jgi:hypothetical protein
MNVINGKHESKYNKYWFIEIEFQPKWGVKVLDLNKWLQPKNTH